ncbi:hypothetical protein AURANDRAFT_68649 [Aureococcus anophagefferens]|uniref:EF-hand domain-containing protein n=1 Tax=Aureococcus anophagefferens TaxID=44056 RepID=F0YQB4_AURAN|nr:hypothetical protein AURANDRAFT_68649 [Aureococcus anophagefferens]EGB02695.1 hypothetical protein AURANDRAFT_68649 [Aureococcus anophagefferens]|eukprot:XP_009042607.1 hypothetical protein AURANDRAFT_68649 [Aureococcus anophagefferens]
MRTALLVALLCSARATKPAAPFDVADEAAAAAGLECPGADVADVAARVEKLGANASTAAVERVLEAAVAASAHARAHRRVALAALPAPAASLALDGVLYRGAVAAHAAAVAAVDRKCGGGFPVAAEARLLAALGAAVDRACGVDGAPPLLARLCRFRKTQERAVVQAVNALAEEFKVKLRYAVEARILSQGGTVQSILREAFLFWDSDASGELNVREFMGAMNRVGMDMSEMHARQIVRYYDRKGNRGRFGDGEIHYMDLVDEIAKAVPHFISHPVPKRAAGPPPSARADGDVAVALPPSIAESKDRLRAAVLRAAPKTRAAKGGQPIPPRDLLHGTLLRIDKAGSGAATAKDLARLARELRAPLNDRELQAVPKPTTGLGARLRELVTWYDVSGSNTLPYAALVEDCFPRGAGARGYAGAAPLPMISASAPPTPSSGMSTSRRKMAKINAEKATIEKRLRQLQEQQKAQKA